MTISVHQSDEDIIDTANEPYLMFTIKAARARTGKDMPADLARIIGDLVMGIPVSRMELEEWGVTALRMIEADDIDVTKHPDLFEPVLH